MIEKNPAIKTNEEYKKEILNKIKNTQDKPKFDKTQRVSEFDNKWNMNNKIIELFANNIEKDQQLKEKYAVILIIILSIQLMALIIIFVFKGLSILKYSDTTFNIFVSGGIAEVFVLVKVIVKYLFKDNLTEALKIIIENNNKPKYKTKNNKNSKSDKPREI